MHEWIAADLPVLEVALAPPDPTMLQHLATALLSVAVLFSASCKCPSFLNKNCTMRVDLALEEGIEVNDGSALIVSVAMVRDSELAEYKAITPEQWFNGDAIDSDQSPRVELSVRFGRITIDEYSAGAEEHFQVLEDGKSVELKFRNLKNPNEGGYGAAVIYADYVDSRNKPPVTISYADVQTYGWRHQVKIGATSVDLVR